MMLEWLEEGFEPERFEIAEVNSMLALIKPRGRATGKRAASRK